MKRFIIYENDRGWLVIDKSHITRYTLSIQEATDMPFRIAIDYLTKSRYLIESPIYQD